MQINIISDTNRRIPRSKIIDLIALIDEEEEPPLSIVNIVFTRDPQIKQLNAQYRNMRKATDVLSFNIDEEPGEENVFGEIYISTDTAANNAKQFGFGYFTEILRLCCHGYLHLLGYDHIEKKEKNVMQSKENLYLGKVIKW